MPLTKITRGALTADIIDSTKLADNAVDTEHLADDTVGLAEMASGTDGAMLTYDADGNPVAITGTDGQVATSAGAGAVSAFEAAGVSGITSDGTDITITSGDLIMGTAGKGIDFSAQTATSATNATTTAEVLNHYEEGTFTAVCKLGGSAISNYTTTSRYTKIGRVVYVSVFLGITGAPGQAGSLTFTGLPFTIGAANNYHCFSIDAHHVPAPGDPEDVWVTGYFLASGTSMHPRNRIGGSVDDSDIDDACDIVFTGFYQVD